MRKIIWMFSGQGSQYFNMGRDLYESDPDFREAMNRCDGLVRRISDESLLNVIFRTDVKDRFADFTNLHHTHPALFSIQFSLAQTLLRRGMKPDLMLGYSLGEIVAAAVGGALPLEAALESLIAQARLLSAAGGAGAMLAVLDSPELWNTRDPLYAGSWVAARNAPQHFVLSGTAAAIERIQRDFKTREIVHHRLPVSVAFHSPLMDALELTFREQILNLKMDELCFPLVSAAYVTQLTRLPPDFVWDVVRRPVRFQETISWLEGRGACAYVDLGPFGTMASFLKYNMTPDSRSRAYTIMTPFNRAGDAQRRMESVISETNRAANC